MNNFKEYYNIVADTWNSITIITITLTRLWNTILNKTIPDETDENVL